MTATQQEHIAEHGRRLLAIFPNALEQDPLALCKKLRRLEAQGAALALRLCNGPTFPTEKAADAIEDGILSKVNALLGNTGRNTVTRCRKCGKQGDCKGNNRNPIEPAEDKFTCPQCGYTWRRYETVPVFLNRDPRGYALKIRDTWMREAGAHLETDWGGYGLIAPEIK